MLDHEFSRRLQEALLKLDPDLFGNITVNLSENMAYVKGQVFSKLHRINDKIEDIVRELSPETSLVFVTVRTRQSGLTVRTDDGVKRSYSSTRQSSLEGDEKTLDEVETLFQGEMDPALLQESPDFKRLNWNLRPKVENCVAVLDVIAPIILDKHLQVIDGNMRLKVARDLGRSTVPVMVLDVEGARAEFLRLALNRSSEFQRWYYADEKDHKGVDTFIDAHPQLQPLLEPLGFFGERILPVTFFGDTILRYTIDEYNGQQQAYRQEEGLEAWAQLQRKRVLEEEKKRKAKKTYAKGEGVASLFDLKPQEKDFMAVHDVKETMDAFVQDSREQAAIITKNFDEVRRAAKEARGQVWQTTRRNTREKAAAKRAAAEAAAKKKPAKKGTKKATAPKSAPKPPTPVDTPQEETE